MSPPQRSEACIRVAPPDRACHSRLPASQWLPMQSSQRVVAQWVPQQAPRGKRLLRFPLKAIPLGLQQANCLVLVSRPPETPEQRQKRKQAEKDRAQAQVGSLTAKLKWPFQRRSDCQYVQAYAEAQSRQLKADQNQNFLKRETPFLCNVRFRCDLPEVSYHARIRSCSCCCSSLCYIKQAEAIASLPAYVHMCDMFHSVTCL